MAIDIHALLEKILLQKRCYSLDLDIGTLVHLTL